MMLSRPSLGLHPLATRAEQVPVYRHSRFTCWSQEPAKKELRVKTLVSSLFVGLAAVCWKKAFRARVLRHDRNPESLRDDGLPFSFTKGKHKGENTPRGSIKERIHQFHHQKQQRESRERHIQLRQFLKLNHKKNKKKGIAPSIEYIDRPDNPWQDRYMLCEECDRNENVYGKKPRKDCNYSTLIELDMTAPFSRNNTMVTSCHVVQLVRDDVWVCRTADGKLTRAENKSNGSFPVQICAVCHKKSTDESRRFRTCATCIGVHYCSEECYAQHKIRHEATCMLPQIPYRAEWGVRLKLKAMRKEIYPLVKMWAIREPETHRVAWLPPPEHQRKLLQSVQKPKKISLPGVGRGRKLLPAPGPLETKVGQNGKIVFAEREEETYVRRVRRSSRWKTPDPDPEFLKTVNMTREEYLEKHAELLALAELEDDDAALAIEVQQPEAEKIDETILSTRLIGGRQMRATTGIRGNQEFTPVDDSPKLVLDKGTLDRVEAAASAGKIDIDQPQHLTKPPWMLPRKGRQEEKDSRYWKQVRESERKHGVVYRESPQREAMKESGLQLSDKAIEQMEEAAEAGRHNKHRMRWSKTPLEPT